MLAHEEQLANDVSFCAIKGVFIFTTSLVKKFSNMTEGKLKPKTTGPFEILWVLSNGTVTIILRLGITNHCILPYLEPTPL